ncbi:MAG: hypothetical protein ABIM50_05370 [Novosphingobium sp.]
MELLVAAMLGALLGMLGPFDTYRMGAGPRMAYWVFLMVAGLAIGRPMVIAGDWLVTETGLPVLPVRCVAIAIGGLPMTLLVALFFTDFDLVRALRFSGLPFFYGQVLLISILTYGVYHTMFRRDVLVLSDSQVPVSFAPPAEVQQAESHFDARLPAGFGTLLALSGEDH